jgi:sterol desaturase/sphingolipid hydroxylase (fatty acid hydroxylase superfamily)
MSLLGLTYECTQAVDNWDGIMSAPSQKSRQHIRGIPVFAQPWFEKYLATAHWTTPGICFFPLSAWLCYRSITLFNLSPWLTLELFASGVFLWTLMEYILHRFIFHTEPAQHHQSKLRQFMLHGYHHEHTNDPRRLVAPPIMSWPMAAIAYTLIYILIGEAAAQALFAGITSGYVIYDWIHFYTHHARPKTRFGKYLRRYHMEHHFKTPETHFGLSSPFWDIIFGTYSTPTLPTRAEIEIVGT